MNRRVKTMTLAEAAELLGCHVETLRRRVRRAKLEVRRGPHGRYHIDPEELSYLTSIRRMRRRAFDTETLSAAWERLERLVGERGAFTSWQRRAVAAIRADPASDIHLFHLLGVHAFTMAGLNIEEVAEQLAISTRQVRRLRRIPLMVGLSDALKRHQAAERGRARARARVVVRELQRQLQETGFRPARRKPTLSNSGARDGVPARIVVVRKLGDDLVRHLLSQGVTDKQLEAITLVGIGPDELNELILRGPGNPPNGSTQPEPEP